MAAGLLGVPLGSFAAQRLRPLNPTCDPLICAGGLLVSAPLIYLGLITARHSSTWCFLIVFFAQLFLNLSWSIVADMLLVRLATNARKQVDICMLNYLEPFENEDFLLKAQILRSKNSTNKRLIPEYHLYLEQLRWSRELSACLWDRYCRSA